MYAKQKGQAEIVILLLVAALGFILVDALSFLGPKNLPKPIDQTVIAFSPTQQRVVKGSTNHNDITIDTGEDKVTMVDLELSFNPKAIDQIDIVPGDFFDNPVPLNKNIDVKNGKISYFLEVKTEAHGIQGTGVLATLTYQVIPTAPLPKTPIVILPLTTAVDPRVHQSVVKRTDSLSLSFY